MVLVAIFIQTCLSFTSLLFTSCFTMHQYIETLCGSFCIPNSNTDLFSFRYTMSKSTALLFILVFAIIFKLEEMVSSVIYHTVLHLYPSSSKDGASYTTLKLTQMSFHSKSFKFSLSSIVCNYDYSKLNL